MEDHKQYKIDSKPIGGFFELELRSGLSYHNGIELNSARNAFRLVLENVAPNKVHLPLFTCDAMLEPLKSLTIPYSFYHINQYFEPELQTELYPDELIVVNNYFGFQTSRDFPLPDGVEMLVDNAQAFFLRPKNGVSSIYSARKFFGVPDGAYLYSSHKLNLPREVQESSQFDHLILRISESPQKAYPYFTNAEEEIGKWEPRKISHLSKRILNSIDYQHIARIRKENFQFLHLHLGETNELTEFINNYVEDVPMFYPFQ